MISKIVNKFSSNALINDSFWAIFGNILGKGLSLLAAIWIARVLGKDIYGEFGFITNTMISIAILSTFGLGYTSTKYIAEFKNTEPGILHAVIKICQNISSVVAFITTLILFFSAEYFAIHVFEQPKLTVAIQFSSIYILFNTIVRTQIGILAGFNDFKGMAKINTIVGVVSIFLNVGMAYLYGLYGALVGAMLIQLMNCILNHKLIGKNLRTYSKSQSSDNKKLSKDILNFSLPVAIQEASYSILNWCYGLLLVKFSTYGEVGLNSAALYWSALILFVPGILRNVILSHLSESLSDKKKHNRILRIVLLFNFVVTFILSIAIYLLSNFIASFYGANFVGLQEVLYISVFTTIFTSMSNVYAQAYMSESRNWLMLLFRILRDGLGLAIGYYLIMEENGLNGALSLAKSSFIVSVIFLVLMAMVYELKIKERR